MILLNGVLEFRILKYVCGIFFRLVIEVGCFNLGSI